MSISVNILNNIKQQTNELKKKNRARKFKKKAFFSVLIERCYILFKYFVSGVKWLKYNKMICMRRSATKQQIWNWIIKEAAERNNKKKWLIPVLLWLYNQQLNQKKNKCVAYPQEDFLVIKVIIYLRLSLLNNCKKETSSFI
jgi:hypothetical protein